MTPVSNTGTSLEIPANGGVRASRAPAPTPLQRRRGGRISAADREMFLAALAEVFSVTHAAALTGRHRRRFYDLRDSDSAFAEAWDEAVAAGTSLLEDELRRRALDGWDEDTFDGDGKLMRRVHRFSPNDLLTMLKKRDPGYRDNVVPVAAAPSITLVEVRLELGESATRGLPDIDGSGRPHPLPGGGGGAAVVDVRTHADSLTHRGLTEPEGS